MDADVSLHLTPARAAAAMAYDAVSGRVVLFGGDSRSGVLGDTWLL